MLTLLVTGCGQDGVVESAKPAEMHQELKIVDPAQYGSSQGAGLVASQALLSIGPIYLEAQLPPLSVAGVPMQTSEVSFAGADAYVTYASVDTAGAILKRGAVQHVKVINCDNPLTLLYTEFCLSAGANLSFPNVDLYASHSDGTSLWVAGSTSDETIDGKYARVFRLNLNAAKDPVSIAATQALASYAGTGLLKIGTSLFVTTGTSSDPALMGGLNLLDAATLNVTTSQPLFDARAIAVDPSDASKIFVARGAVSTANPGAVAVFPADLSTTPSRTIATGGNLVPESHSSVQVGSSLVLTSMGDQGFRVSCKSTGASLATVPAPVVAGILPAKTVTNSVLAVPGYILAANGEAGVYVYTFNKSSALNTNYCQGVTVTLLGRLSLAAGGTYVNGELSANSLTYLPFFNLLNVLTGRFVLVASGNKGVSLLNLSSLTISLTAVNDF